MGCAVTRAGPQGDVDSLQQAHEGRRIEVVEEVGEQHGVIRPAGGSL